MSRALQPMTEAEYLAWEERQERPFEFDGFRPVAMNGGTVAHGTIGTNLVFELSLRLRGKQCRAYGPSLKILVAGRVRYPDAFVACSPVANKATWLTEPVVVFEVHGDRRSNGQECRVSRHGLDQALRHAVAGEHLRRHL